jgi:tRNA nucleotidyltransferase (CCA-adding enzyme)
MNMIKMDSFILPQYIVELLDKLEEAGFEAYLVGGCVRDMLLGRQPSDYDIATKALPEELTRVFEKTVPTGVKYGTVTVLMNENKNQNKAEVTTFRREEGYDDYRRPSAVTLGGELISDLSRRDFTVNAMAYHPRKGLIDPFYGQRDLDKRLIRAAGQPRERFYEDALRVLRAFRFAAQLDFEIEDGTLRAAEQAMPLCAHLSGERVRVELSRILLSPRPSLIFEPVRLGLFEALGLEYQLPENVQRLDATPLSIHARWAAFLMMSACGCDKLIAMLKFDHTVKRKIDLLLRELDRMPPQSAAEIKRRLRLLPPPLFEEYLRIYAALSGEDVSRQLLELDGILQKEEPYKPEMLAVRGEDLLRAGMKPGPACGRMLAEMLDYVIVHPQANSKEMLLQLFKI